MKPKIAALERFIRGCASAMTAHFILIAAATFLFHHSALERWWGWDDTQILKHATGFSPLEYFTSPEAWQALINTSLTPWLSFAYDIDLTLFGYEPLWFYAHNLLAILGCAWLIYLLVRPWTGSFWGLAAALLFLAGAPTTVNAQQLMTRHYGEGLFFYLLAMWLVLRGFSNHRMRYGLLAGLAFAVAASAKEIYLPLGFVPLLLPIGTWRQRLLVAWPILVVMALYVPWRWYMLGDVVGGYTPHSAFVFSDLTTVPAAFSAVPEVLWSSPVAALLASCGLLFLSFLHFGKRFPLVVWRLCVLFALLVLPLFPLIKFAGLTQARFYVGAWAAFSLVVSLLAGLVTMGVKGRQKAVIFPVVLFLLILIAWPAWKASRVLLDFNEAQHASYRAQGAVVGFADSPILYASPDISPWFLSGLVDLRSVMGVSMPVPKFVYDESQLIDEPPRARRVLRYSPDTRMLTDITPRLPELLALWRGRLRLADLSVRLEYHPQLQVLTWHGSGQGIGKAMTVIVPGAAYPLPLQGSLRHSQVQNSLTPSIGIRFRFETEDGGIAYSPVLHLPGELAADGARRLIWTGRSDMFEDSSPSRSSNGSAP